MFQYALSVPLRTPLPKAYDCVAVYIAGRRTSLVVYGGGRHQPKSAIWEGNYLENLG